jgi:flagellar biosynthesis protein FlhB
VADKHDKTEAPTPKRRRDARKKGQVAKTPELAPWMVLLTATYAIPSLVHRVRAVSTTAFAGLRQVSKSSDPNEAVRIFGTAMTGGFLALLPLLLTCFAVGVVSQLTQTRGLVSLHVLKPDLKRINPLKGLRGLFSVKSLWRTIQQLAKAGIITAVAYPHVRALATALTSGGRVPLFTGLGMVASGLVAMVRAVTWAVLTLAIIDFVRQRRSFMKGLKMSKHEVKEEAKQSEGNPQIKGRIRGMQLAISRNRMMSAVADASVVVTNPTHIAVALRYEPLAGGAPRVVAIGIDDVARRIRERAREHGVPVIEAKPLARALWRSCEVGDEIPTVLYEAVAKVLAFVRRLKGTLLESAAVLPLPHTYQADRTLLDALPARPRHRRRRVAA